MTYAMPHYESDIKMRKEMIMFKKLAALILSAVILCTGSVSAFSEEPLSIIDIEASLSDGASSEWNGKTALKSGKSYTVSKNVTISKTFSLPKNSTITVKNGAKLWISTAGKLNLKGTINVEKGGILAVSGTLYQYSSGKLNISGELRFGDKAKVTLNGKTAVKSTGTAKGNPKTLSVGKNPTFTVSGKISSAKLSEAVNKNGIGKMLSGYFKTCLCEQKIEKAVRTAFPKSYVAFLEKGLSEADSSLAEYCSLFAEALSESLKASGISTENIKNITANVKSITDITDKLTAEQQEIKKIYGNVTKVYEAAFTVKYNTGSAGTESVEYKLNVAQIGSKWYIF